MEEQNKEQKLLDSVANVVQEQGKKNVDMVNKRIDFDNKTMKRLNTMLPLYKDELGSMRDSELYSHVVRIAVNALFEGDFKKKLEEL